MAAATAAAVKRYSNIGALRAGAAFSLFSAAIMGFVAVFLWTLSRDVAPNWLVALCASTILVFLGLALFSFRGARFWTRQDAKRQAVVLGGANVPPLAIEQPRPRDGSPAVTGRIAELRMRRWFRPVMWVIVAAACILFSYDSEHSGPILGISICGVIAVALLVISGGIRATSGQYVVLTDEGLALVAFGFEQAIAWDDARVFCIPRGTPYSSPRYCKLSGPKDIVQWWRLDHSGLLARLYEPVVPYPEYIAQVEALLSLIAARTGLPLYDLR